jgi:hypothetical protein
MGQRRWASTGAYLAVLICLFVLSVTSPRLWDYGSIPPAHARPDRSGAHTSDRRVDLGGSKILLPSEEYRHERTGSERPDEFDDMFTISPPPSPLPDGEARDEPTIPELKMGVLPAADGPAPAKPAGKIAAQAVETDTRVSDKALGKSPEPTPQKEPEKTPEKTVQKAAQKVSAGKGASETLSAPVLPESMRRLPLVVAHIPSPARPAPHDLVLPSDKASRSDVARPQAATKSPPPAHRLAMPSVDDSWRDPVTLLESLGSLAVMEPTSRWAAAVSEQIHALGSAIAGGSGESAAIFKRLTDLNRQATKLAANISDATLARRLRKTGFALGRRLDVWQEVVRLGAPQSAVSVTPEVDPQKLSLCLAKIDSLTGGSAEGQAWRNYLLVDALKESLQRQPSLRDEMARRIAQETMARLTETPLTSHQQEFVSSEPVAALRGELRRWAAEPVGAAVVLRDIETYERTGMPSDAHRLALDYENLNISPIESRRQLGDRVDIHYRNANCRIAVTEELMNKLIPERSLEYGKVDDTVLGRPVWGESLTATDVAVRMLPDTSHARMALEVRGEVSALTTADAGPARFHSDSQSYYIARKPLEVDMNGISLWPVEVAVSHDSQLRGVETPLDRVPLIGGLLNRVAQSQLEQNSPAATEEIRQKVATRARDRIDAEARQQLTAVIEQMNKRVFDPLNSLSLDPQMVAAETTEKRFTMRLRLAGEDQLGSHTPRPQAPAETLASVQLHESVLNNGVQRLQLDGHMFTLAGLSQHVAKCLSRPAAWEINPDHRDVKITFADKDAVVIRCQDGRLILTLSINKLCKGRHRWKEPFVVRAFYRPEINGRSAQFVRDGVIHLIGQRLNMGSQIALRGIFSHALSKNNPWGLVPDRIVKEPKLSDAAITQFVIDDGWIGVALGPKSTAMSVTFRPGVGWW